MEVFDWRVGCADRCESPTDITQCQTHTLQADTLVGSLPQCIHFPMRSESKA